MRTARFSDWGVCPSPQGRPGGESAQCPWMQTLPHRQSPLGADLFPKKLTPPPPVNKMTDTFENITLP